MPEGYDCIKYSLVDPELINQGQTIEEATTLTVAALMRGDYIDDFDGKSPAEIARQLESRIIGVDWRKGSFKKWVNEAGGVLYLSFCAKCGHSFKLVQHQITCRSKRHQVVISRDDGFGLLHRQAYLPAKVVKYIKKEMKHQFHFEPPRP